MQEDHLQPHLTVLESMEMASKLRNCSIKLSIYQHILVRITYCIYNYYLNLMTYLHKFLKFSLGKLKFIEIPKHLKK